MKITNIRHYHIKVVNKELLMVQVETDEGIMGIGEATLRTKLPAVKSCIQLLASKLVGTDPFELEKVFFEYFYHDRWRNGVIMNTALSGVEMAIIDLISKKLNIPAYNFMGGKIRDKVLMYVNGWQDLNGLDAVENAKRMVKEGFKALKWNPIPDIDVCSSNYHLLSRDAIRQAIKEVGDVREAVGNDIELFIECHGRLDYDESLRLAKGIEEFRPGFIEEPMQPDNINGFKKLVNHINSPLAGGERIFTRWGHIKTYEEGYLSIAQPDFTHCGGLMEAKRISALADTFYLKIAPHNSSGPVATIASGQVDITLPNFFMQEFVYEKNIEANKLFFNDSMTIEDGYLILSHEPGLGINPNFEALEASHKEVDKSTDSVW